MNSTDKSTTTNKQDDQPDEKHVLIERFFGDVVMSLDGSQVSGLKPFETRFRTEDDSYYQQRLHTRPSKSDFEYRVSDRSELTKALEQLWRDCPELKLIGPAVASLADQIKEEQLDAEELSSLTYVMF